MTVDRRFRTVAGGQSVACCELLLTSRFEEPVSAWKAARSQPSGVGLNVARLAFALLLASSAIVPAQEPPPSEETEAGSSLGGFGFVPSLGVSFGYDDNITLASRNEISSTFWQLSTAVRLIGGNARNQLTAEWSAEVARYADSPLDDYEDQRVSLAWDYNPKLRHALGLDVSYGWLHDRRGTESREGDLGLLPIEPDEYERSELGGYYRFGAPGARGRLEFDARFGRTAYSNNTELTEARDRDDSAFSGAFYWRIAPKTSALVRAELASFDYDEATLDGDEKHLFLGLEFDATARTSGRLMLGTVRKDFDDPAREGFSGTSWRAAVTWKPRSYSIFDLSTGRDTDETNGYGDYILREDVTFAWAHNWTTRFRTTVDAGYAQEEHRPSPRDDDVVFFGIAADYLFRPWLRFGASVKRYDRASSLDELEYDRNVFMLSAEFTRQ